MPAAVREMIIDGPQILGLQTPDCFSTTGFFQAPNGCNPTDMHRNFYCTKKVGHYLIGKTLGEGSFAKVREGLHVITDEKVAIKVIDKHKVRNDEYVMKNLYREAQIQQMIRHPNIAQLLDIMETDNNYYLVTELCVGGNLLNRVYERRHLEEHEVQKYIRQLSIAVEHLHRAGVVHRDLKIENLLLDENDNIKLIDFGLSNCAGLLGYTDPFSTQCGSPAYAAPELLNRQNYGPKVDVWSIGVNMYAMLTGTLPFTVEPFSLTLLHDRMVNKEMNPLPPYISPGAVMLLRNLLEPDPIKRPAIRQVANTPWLHDGQVPMNLSYLNRLHNKDINHVVVQHMTEKMGYKYSDVLSNVNNNRACSTLATYFLLNKKMERLLKVNVEPAEKEVKPPQPLQESAYLAGGRSQARDSVLTTGLLRPIGWDSVRYHGGTVPSPSGAYLEINHFMPLMPLPDLRHHRRLEAQNLLARGPVQGGLGFSTSSRVMGVPTYSPVIGVPTSSRVMGVPMSSRVTGVPTYSPVTGVPTISQVMGLHTSSRIMGVPTSSLFVGAPTHSRIMGVPTSSLFVGAPTHSRIMGVPTSSRIMGVPTSSQFVGAPTHSRIMGVPTSSQFVGAPTRSRIMGVPTSSQFVGAPTRSRIMGVPTSSQFVGAPTRSRIMGVPTSSQFVGAPTRSRIMGVPTSSQFVGAPTSSRIMGVPTSSRVMGYSWDTSFQEMNSRQKPTPPWLRLTNGPLPHLTHLQRNAPTPRITPTPRPSAPTPALTNLGVQARLRLAKMDRQQDAKFPAMGIAQILRRPTPSPTLPDYRMQTLRYPGGNPRTIY